MANSKTIKNKVSKPKTKVNSNIKKTTKSSEINKVITNSKKESEPKQLKKTDLSENIFSDKKTDTKKSIKFSIPKNNPLINKLVSIFGFLLILFATFLIIDFFFQYKANSLSVAIINGQSINRDEFRSKLEKSEYGQYELNRQLQYIAIEQEATSRSIALTSEEFDNFYKIVIPNEEAEIQAEQDLASKGITLEEYKNDLKVILLGAKILMSEDPINDEDLEVFFETYKTTLYPNEDPTFQDKKNEITQYFILDKFISSNQVENLGNDLVSKASVQNNITNEPKYSIFGYTTNIIKNLQNKLNTEKE